MARGRHTCFLTLTLTATTVACTAMLKSPGVTFDTSDTPQGEVSKSGPPAGLDAGAGVIAALDCLDQLPKAAPDPRSIDVTVIAFNKFDPTSFDASDDDAQGVRLDSYTAQPETAIQGCFRWDTACAFPATPEVVTNDAGTAHLALSSVFDGFLRIRRDRSLPGVYYPGRFPSGGQPVTWFVSAISVDDVTYGLGVVGAPRDAQPAGTLIVGLYDCRDQPLAGATIELNVDAAFKGYPQSPSSDSTSAAGTRVFGGVSEGNVTVSATLKETGRALGTRSIYVDPSELTFADIRLR